MIIPPTLFKHCSGPWIIHSFETLNLGGLIWFKTKKVGWDNQCHLTTYYRRSYAGTSHIVPKKIIISQDWYCWSTNLDERRKQIANCFGWGDKKKHNNSPLAKFKIGNYSTHILFNLLGMMQVLIVQHITYPSP